MKKLLILALLSVWMTGTGASAQNWRTPNPNQPNGYRATSAAYHYSGSYKEPAQPSNGYHASEARSKAGMSCFTPPSSSEKSSGGRWGGGESGRSEGGRWGGSESGRFGGSEGGRWDGNESGYGGEARRWGNATGSSFQNAGPGQNRQEEWNEFYKRRFEATEHGGYNNQMPYAQQQQQYAGAQGAPLGGNFGGYSAPGESFGSAQAMRAAVGASAVRRMLRNGNDGTFNQVYNNNSGGFNRIYGAQ